MSSAPSVSPTAPRVGLPRLAAFDIDGTLIGRSGMPTPRTVDALDALDAAGVMTVIATGRPWPQVEPLARRARGMSYAVCLNGAVVMDARASEQVADRSMTHTEAIEAAEIARKLLPEVRLGLDMADGRHLWEHNFVPDMPAGLAADLRIDRVDDAIAAVDGPVLTWLVETPGTEMMTAVGELAPEMPLGTEIRPSGLDLAEIAAAGVNKSTGLEIVCQRYGIKPADVVAFGDGLNDIDMLRWAGRSVAMSNAPPQVRAVADLVAPSNESEGVAVVVEAMLTGGGWPPDIGADTVGSASAAMPQRGGFDG
ncbi:HAD family hydrolase [Candidatus Poriferisodalis sp.]|uniref:HAD family hydrolase n=1 Tax=Candidatus Poriferisodalis sp. TaxID=3101277 RepID=UPI003B5CC459